MGQIHFIEFPPFYNIPDFPNHSDVIYSGSPYSGLWKSINGGTSWASVGAVEHLPVSSVNNLTFSKEQDYTIYITTGGVSLSGAEKYGSGLWKSTDFGNTFESVVGLNDVFDFNHLRPNLMTSVDVSPFNSDHLLVATSDGIYRSLDRGDNWELISDIENYDNELSREPGFWTVKFSKIDPDLAYCSGMELYKIEDVLGGTPNVSIIPNQTNTCNAILGTNINFRLYLDPESLHEIVLMSGYYVYDDSSCDNHNNNAVYKYDNYDDTWSLLSNASYHNVYADIPTADRLKIAADPDNLDKLMAGYTETRITLNNGSTWNTATQYQNNGHADIHAIEFAPDGSNTFWVGTDGGIFKYNVNSTQVTEANNGFSTNLVWQLSTSRLSKSNMAIGKQDAKGDWFNGTNWFQMGDCADGYPPVIWDKTKKDEFYISLNENIKKYNTTTNTLTDISEGCTKYGNFIQNPATYEDDEFFAIGHSQINYPTLSPFRASVARSREQFNHATNFRLMDSVGRQSNLWEYGIGAIYMSASDKNALYAWNYFGHPQTEVNTLFKFNKANYFNYQASCTSLAQKNNTNLKYDQILYLPKTNPNYYTTSIACSLAARYVNGANNPNTELAKMHYLADMAVSNLNKNKLWVALVHNLTYRGNVANFVIHLVRKSTDGGLTWVDDQVGLPIEPMAKLIYVDGSNDLLFCATSTGRVFYKDANMASWLELDPNLPHCDITTMEVNYCTRTLNIATYGRGVWRYDLTQGPTAQKELTITTNTTWSDEQFDVGANIVVKKGAKLTINSNSIINMCKDCKIVLEVGDANTSGGQLQVDNSTLTNLCGEYWKGVEVQGDLNANQILTAQIPNAVYCKNARCYINGSTIENMYNGIINYSPTVLPITYGGQILAINSTFVNNRYSINLYVPQGYQPSNTTLFSKYYQTKTERCYFINKNRTEFISHIFAQGVRGLAVLGNRFVDSVAEASTDKGYGIWTIGCSVEVVPFDNGTLKIKNVFKGLTYGIYMNGNAPYQLNNSFVTKIARANFIDNTYGIYLNAISNPIVIEDSMKVAIVSDPIVYVGGMGLFPPNKSFGLYLTGCTNYKVQDNQIYTTRTPSTFYMLGNPQPYGLLISNGHTAFTKIRRNTFTQLRYAAVADGMNGTAGAGNQGLLFQCNNFVKSEKYDLWLTGYQFTFGGTTYTVNGVIPNQGRAASIPYNNNDENYASQNTFQQYSASLPQYQLIRNNFSSSYTYYYYTSPGNLNPARILATYQIFKLPGVIGVCNTDVNSSDYTPTSNKNDVDEVTNQRDSFDIVNRDWAKRIKTHTSLIDVLQEIEFSNFVADSILQSLVPYLENEGYKENVKQILINHGGINSGIEKSLVENNISLSLSDWLKLKTSIEAQLSSEDKMKSIWTSKLLVVEDRLKTEFEKLMEEQKIKEAFAVLEPFLDQENIALLYFENKYAVASKVEKIGLLNQMSKSKSKLIHRLAAYYKIASSDKGNIAAVKKLLKEVDFISFKALSLFSNNDSITYTPYLPDVEEAIEQEPKSDWQKVKTTSGIKIRCTPNPADDELNLGIVSEKDEKISIQLFDINGKKIHQEDLGFGNQFNSIIETTIFNDGLYLLKVSSGNSSESLKFEIIHKK